MCATSHTTRPSAAHAHQRSQPPQSRTALSTTSASVLLTAVTAQASQASAPKRRTGLTRTVTVTASQTATVARNKSKRREASAGTDLPVLRMTGQKKETEMFWTIATYIWRIAEVLVLLVLAPVLYRMTKELFDDTKCLSCSRVSIEVWACHADRKYCINCCGCPEHADTTHPYRHCSTAPANTWCGKCAEVD